MSDRPFEGREYGLTTAALMFAIADGHLTAAEAEDAQNWIKSLQGNAPQPSTVVNPLLAAEPDCLLTYADGTTWPWWVHIEGDPEEPRGLSVTLSDDALVVAYGEGWEDTYTGGLSHAECHAAALRLHAEIMSRSHMPRRLADLETLRFELTMVFGLPSDASRGDILQAASVAMTTHLRVGSLESLDVEVIGPTAMLDCIERTLVDAGAAPEDGDSLADVVQGLVEDRAELESLRSALTMALDLPSDARRGEILQVASVLDETVPPRGWTTLPGRPGWCSRDDGQLCKRITAAHADCRADAEPYVAAATATLVAERDTAHALCRRAVKYAFEDRMRTPGKTRLQRVLDEMARAVGPGPVVDERDHLLARIQAEKDAADIEVARLKAVLVEVARLTAILKRI